MVHATAGDWFRGFGRAPRIMGLDVARALAILGMIGAHIGEVGDRLDPSDPSTWSSLVHGHPSVLFAVLAGVSVALMTGAQAGPRPERLPALRLGLVGRGATIFVIGLLLELLHTPIAIILTLYGVLYIALIPALRWRARTLLVVAGALALGGPAVLALVTALGLGPSGQGVAFALYGSYPLTVWLVYALAGMALGRLGIGSIRTAAWMLGAGAASVIAGHALGEVGRRVGVRSEDAFDPRDSAAGFTSAGWDSYPDRFHEMEPGGAVLRALLAVDPHSGGTADILAAGGVAVMVIAACVLASESLRAVLLPFAALGSMPLTAYTAHVVSYVVIASPAGHISDNLIWLSSSVVLLALTTLWSMAEGRGPLERLTARIARASASAG